MLVAATFAVTVTLFVGRQMMGYVDWLKRLGRRNYSKRPFCDLCGAFRGRRLRPIPPIHNYDAPEDNWRCEGCDNE